MLAAFRSLAGTMLARLFFIVLAISFVGWGVADMARNVAGGSTYVVKMGSETITPQEFEGSYRREWQAAAAKLHDPSQPPPGLRQQVAMQTLQRLVNQKLLAAELTKLHLVTPDETVRQLIFAMPVFKNPETDKFDHTLMVQRLQGAQMTEAQFLTNVRQQETQDQLTDSLAPLMVPPDVLMAPIYAYLDESRTADTTEITFKSQTLPKDPTNDELTRFWTNHPQNYSAPEYRHVHIILLSPKTLGRSIKVTDQEVDEAYRAMKDTFDKPEKRSIEVISVDSDKVAGQLLAKWRGGLNWQQMQDLAKAQGGTSVSMDDATRASIPSPDLAQAVFSAKAGTVVGPVKAIFGVQIARLRSILPATTTPLTDARAKVRDMIAEQRATGQMDTQSQKLQDLFAGGATLEEVPADLGAQAFAGTMDAQGHMQDGTPVPLPGSPQLVQNIVAAAFKPTKVTQKNDSINVVEGPDHSFYALSVDSISQPAPFPFESVRTKVIADWQAQQRRQEAEAEAAQLLHQVQTGTKLVDAAGKVGLGVNHSPSVVRSHTALAMSQNLQAILFSLTKEGDATMVETPDGFTVAVLTGIAHPAPDKANADYQRDQQQVSRLLNEDQISAYIESLREASPITVNQKLLDTLTDQSD